MKINIDNFRQTCEECCPLFEEKVLPMKYIPSGIFLWEGFAFCAMAEFYGIDMIIESGTAGGMSTEIFARYFNFPIHTIDDTRTYGTDLFISTRRRLKKYPNVTCHTGDANITVPILIEKNNNRKIGLMFDGPKGRNATKLARECFKRTCVKYVGVHDECHKDRYHEMSEWDKTFFFTDDPWFLEKYSFLDDGNRRDINWLSNISPEKKPGGAGIGFAINE